MEACGKIFLLEEKFFSRGCARGLAVTLHRQSAKRRPAGQGIKILIFMKTQNSARSTKGANTETKNAVKNNAATTQRVVETRDMWEVIFNHSVSLVVAYTRGQQVEDPRKGYAFASVAQQPHSRAYAKSLIWGFATSKAGKVLKDFDDLAKRESREKIAIAILTDTTLVKGDSKAIAASLSKVEPKREKAFATAVLTELSKPQTETTTKGGKAKAEDTKATTPKGGKAKGESKPKTNTKGVGESLRQDYEATIQATGKLLEAMGAVEKTTAPKGSKAKSETKKSTTKGGRKSATKQAAK